jgi:hypothetical protein
MSDITASVCYVLVTPEDKLVGPFISEGAATNWAELVGFKYKRVEEVQPSEWHQLSMGGESNE